MDKQYLEARAALLQRVRRFFSEQGFLEVETPLLGTEVIPELHIEPLQATLKPPGLPGDAAPQRYLQASPELAMKRLLCAGAKAIFQITRSFRGGELGRLHREEFTLLEWYRVGDRMAEGIDLLDQLVQEVAAAPAARRVSYQQLFESHVGVNPHRSTVAELAEHTSRLGLSAPLTEQSAKDEWLNLLWALCVEPQLGSASPEIVVDYPAGQAALAKTETMDDGVTVARRFELYWQGVELANGYDELTDAAELRRRLTQVNEQRVADSRPAAPLPESLLTAMTQPGLPACAGCALGLDRLLMLVAGASSIDELWA